MTTATVKATSLNLRSRPMGPIIGSLKGGTTVRVLARTMHPSGEWLEVEAGARRGFVSARYVTVHAPAPADAPSTAPVSLPPDASESDLRTSGRHLLGPDGIVVGTLYKLGIYNRGRVSIADFLRRHPHHFSSVSPSLVRVMSAVSENEGALEAINTWDNAFLSFGALQWTAGSGNAPGELGGLLARLRTRYPDAFEEHFGRHGLSTAPPASNPRILDYSHLLLNGRALDTPQAKAVLRKPIWAYRFWRAGHDEAVCRCEIEHAMARLDVFYTVPQASLGGRSVADLVSSEWGVALLYDQHTNRPGHVPGTLVEAWRQCVTGELVPEDTARWNSTHERVLLGRYLALRHRTSMTDSLGRAERLARAVDSARLSSERGSFVM